MVMKIIPTIKERGKGFDRKSIDFAGKVHVKNTAEQLKLVGPRSLGVSLLTAGFVGMVFTIQVRDYT